MYNNYYGYPNFGGASGYRGLIPCSQVSSAFGVGGYGYGAPFRFAYSQQPIFNRPGGYGYYGGPVTLTPGSQGNFYPYNGYQNYGAEYGRGGYYQY